MTLAQYARMLRQQWWLVLLLMVVAVAGAAAYTSTVTPQYQARVKLFVSVSGKSDVTDLSSGSLFTQQRVKSYADIVTSPSVLAPVINQLSLPYTVSELASRVSADSPLDTVLLNVTVTDSSPQFAAAIANAISVQFPKLVDQLETPVGSTRSPVKISLTEPATAPTIPISPRKSLNLALGLLVGLGLGVGAAVLRDQLNTRVRSVMDVERITKAVPLGIIPFDADAKKQPLVSGDKFNARAEAFRTLRTNLQFADVDNPPRVIVVTSPMPDEGKTTTACNIALTLALSGAHVVLIDADLRKPRVSTYLGMDSSAGLTTVLSGQHDLRSVMVRYQRDLMAVLPAGRVPPNPSELLGSQHMTQLIATLKNHYDSIVIDAPPLLPVSDASILAAQADGVLMVVRHGKTRREQIARALQSLRGVNAKLLGSVINFAPRKARGGYGGYGYGVEYADKKQPEHSTERQSARLAPSPQPVQPYWPPVQPAAQPTAKPPVQPPSVQSPPNGYAANGSHPREADAAYRQSEERPRPYPWEN